VTLTNTKLFLEVNGQGDFSASSGGKRGAQTTTSSTSPAPTAWVTITGGNVVFDGNYAPQATDAGRYFWFIPQAGTNAISGRFTNAPFTRDATTINGASGLYAYDFGVPPRNNNFVVFGGNTVRVWTASVRSTATSALRRTGPATRPGRRR